MIAIWGLILGMPILALGGGMLLCGERISAFKERFERSRIIAGVLTVLAWFWTAYECDIIGIDVFDMLLKRFPHELWFLAVVLSYLTIIWMPKNLSVRALTGIFMLIPAELFKATRPFRPDGGFAAVHFFVITGYVLAIIGMYGMFYPWRIEKAASWILARPVPRCVVAALFVADAMALIFFGLRLGKVL